MNQYSAYLVAVLAAGCATEHAAKQPVPQGDLLRGVARTQREAAEEGTPVVAKVQVREVGEVPTFDRKRSNLDERARAAASEAEEPAPARAAGQPAGVAEGLRRQPIAATPKQEHSSSPLQQGNHTYDLEVTRKIRKAIMDDDELSFIAKNVKIVSSQGEVTLRGSVRDAAEMRTIETYAKQIAGADHVHNQLAPKN